MDEKTIVTEVTENETERKENYSLSTELQSNIFSADEQRIKKATSLDINDEEQQDLLLGAMSEVDFKLNDEKGKVLEVIGYYAQEIPYKTYSDETGEEIVRKKHTLTLFTSDSKSHVTGSNACFMSFNDIISIKGIPSKENPLYLKVVETPAKEKGHTYLRLKPVKKEDVNNG